MKKGLIFLLFVFLNATEFEYGHGDFNIDFGLLGLNKNHTEKIQTFSILQRHKNILSSNWFYAYRFSWFKSKKIKTLVNDYNSNVNNTNNLNKLLSDYSGINNTSNSTNSTGDTNTSDNNTSGDTNVNNTNNNYNNGSDSNSSVPTLVNLSNKIRGLDINFIFGRDLINKNIQDTYLGVGILAGVTLPYIKSSSNSDSNYLKKTKTKIITYKIGGIIKGGFLLNPFMQIYSDASYSFQTARVKNNELNINSKSSGNNFFYDIGAKFQLKTVKDFGWIKLTPAMFFTLGYRYNYWKVKSIKISNQNLLIKSTKLSFVISQFYIGLGYDF